jgi:hypothetical protein
MPPGVEHTRRAVYWHDWTRTAVVARKILALDVRENLKRKVKRAGKWHRELALHVGLLLRNLMNTGTAIGLLEQIGTDQAIDDAADLGPDGDGYCPAPPQEDPTVLAAYEESLKHGFGELKNKAVDAYAEKAFLELAERFRAIGVTPIFFTAPGSAGVLPARFSHADAPTVLVFNDATLYPSLYRPEVRRDQSHFNAAGAEEFTRLFAQRVLELTQPGQ